MQEELEYMYLCTMNGFDGRDKQNGDNENLQHSFAFASGLGRFGRQ
jgi:hypothetical protein